MAGACGGPSSHGILHAGWWCYGAHARESPRRTAKGWAAMGDKSPKAKDKAKKQGAADKNQQKAAASEKAAKQSANPKKAK